MTIALILLTIALAVAFHLLIDKLCEGNAVKKALAWIFLGIPALLSGKVIIEGILISI